MTHSWLNTKRNTEGQVDYKIMLEGLQMIGQFFGEDYKPEAIKAVQK